MNTSKEELFILAKLLGNMSKSDIEDFNLNEEESQIMFDFYEKILFENDDFQGRILIEASKQDMEFGENK